MISAETNAKEIRPVSQTDDDDDDEDHDYDPDDDIRHKPPTFFLATAQGQTRTPGENYN